MDLTELREFFRLHVKEYLPYRHNQVFRTLMEYLTGHYFRRLYLDLPADFRELFENQHLLVSVYDQLLAALGLPDDIIRRLTFPDKLIILSALHDFQRYKASVSFFQAVGRSFNDRFNIYELYYDRTDTGWVLKPRLIYRHPLVEVLTEVTLPYEEVYRQVFTLLIPEEELEHLYQDGRVVFPLKSNLLLLDYTFYTDVSVVISLAVATFLKDYGDLEVPLYFSDWSTQLSVTGIFYLWHLLLTRRFGTVWLGSNSQAELLQFATDPDQNPYHIRPPLDDWHLDRILEQFDRIASRQDAETFRREVLERWFLIRQRPRPDVTADEMVERLAARYPELWNYVEARLAQNPVEELPRLLEEIYNSCLVFQYLASFEPVEREWFCKYFSIFLGQLPQVVVRPDKTTSWLLLYNLKPFHTEFIQRLTTGLLVDDPLNGVWVDSGNLVWFALQFVRTSALHLTETVTMLALERQVVDGLPVLDRLLTDLRVPLREALATLRDLGTMRVTLERASASALGETQTLDLARPALASVGLVSAAELEGRLPAGERLVFLDAATGEWATGRQEPLDPRTETELVLHRPAAAWVTLVGATTFVHRLEERARIGQDRALTWAVEEGVTPLSLGTSSACVLGKEAQETAALVDTFEIQT